MIPRAIEPKLLSIKNQFPAIGIFGPRQSGKTTLAKKLFPHHRYINLESFDEQEFAEKDPKGFLSRFHGKVGIILDEIQKAPRLLSYIQVEIDEKNEGGRFILLSSQNILLNPHISQTLAGRIALTKLLPFYIKELRRAEQLPKKAIDAIFQGFYPRVYDNHLDPVVFVESYIRTYIERDARDIKQIVSLTDFQKFMRLCAGNIGQLLNITSLSREAGISIQTIKAWISILEASYIIFLLEPYYMSYNKRIVKSPKLYFYDLSLACSLLRLSCPDDVFTHHLRGELFESMIVSNMLKNRYNHCLPPNISFWRDRVGNEVDAILEEGTHMRAFEIKSTETLNSSLFDGFTKWCKMAPHPLGYGGLIYGGEESHQRKGIPVSSWCSISSHQRP